VTATVLDHVRGDKILVFKKWRRNDSRKLQGHRQDYTAILVKAIEA
jgi:large subunit ribosomal protein L21